MVNCTVLRCNSRSEQNCEDISFHRYPSDDLIRNKWIVATGRHQWTPTEFHRICSKHFEPQCFRKAANKSFLDKSATPTLFVHTESMESNRRILCKDEKLSIIRAIEAGERVTDVARRFSYRRSTVNSIWRSKERILRPKVKEKSRTLKKPQYEDLDQAVLSWFQRQRQENIAVSGPILKAEADHIGLILGKTTFNASQGWLTKFKERHGISYCKETRSFDTKLSYHGNIMPKLEENYFLTKQDAEPGSSKEDPLRDSDSPNSSDTNDRHLLRRTIEQCRFCGDYGTECTDIFYLSFLNKRKTTIVFNELSIQLDFKSTTLPTAVCGDCNEKLLEIREFVLLVKETQERFKLEKRTKKKIKGKRDDKDADKNKKIISDDNEDTRDAFEDEDLIQCDVPEDVKQKHEDVEDQIEQVVIKTEYESDNDTKEGILDSLTVEETIVSKYSKSTKEDTTKRKNDNEGILDYLAVKETVVAKDSKGTNEDTIKLKEDTKEGILDYFTVKENVVMIDSKNTKYDTIKRKKDTNEGILGSITVEETVFMKDSKRTKEDTAKRKKAKVEATSVTFDIAIEEEVTPTKVTNEGYLGLGTSGLGATCSAPKSINYITIDGLTGTLLVQQGKREETK